MAGSRCCERVALFHKIRTAADGVSRGEQDEAPNGELERGEMARVMAPGSVIIDLAAERGGNCELTKAGETVIDNEVRIIGPMNIASGTAVHASQMFARNTVTLLKLLIEKGLPKLDLEDEIIRETLWVHEGKVVHGN